MKLVLTENFHDARFDQFFPIGRRSAFHEADVLTAIAPKWYSVLIFDGSMAFHNSFCASPIDGTGLFDVEPLLGYAGPLVTTADQDFIRAALELYSNTCSELKIIAELVRFDPMLKNHLSFLPQGKVEITAAKRVIVVSCFSDPANQMSQFSQPCRRRLRAGLRQYRFERLHGAAGFLRFRAQYETSVRRLNLNDRWLFSDQLYDNAAKSDLFATYGVYDGDRLVSSALVVHHPRCSHYMLVASVADYPPGASELLIFGIARECASLGTSHLMLGGGRTAAPDDGLLRFKQKFAKGFCQFHIGHLIHDGRSYRELCDGAIVAEPSLASSSFFLKYRLRGKE